MADDETRERRLLPPDEKEQNDRSETEQVFAEVETLLESYEDPGAWFEDAGIDATAFVMRYAGQSAALTGPTGSMKMIVQLSAIRSRAFQEGYEYRKAQEAGAS